MMSCAICHDLLTTEELGKRIRCDQCGGNLCQDCSGLGATEVRVMQLTGKRTLKLVCKQCCSPDGLPFNGFERRMTDFEMSIKEHHDTSIASLKAEFSVALEKLAEQFIILKETNIQLIHLINPSLGPSAIGGFQNNLASHYKPFGPALEDPDHCSRVPTVQLVGDCNGPFINETKTADELVIRAGHSKASRQRSKPNGMVCERNSTASIPRQSQQGVTHTHRPSQGKSRGRNVDVIEGVSESLDASDFRPAEKKGWIHVSRCGPGSTVEGLCKFLKSKLPSEEFDITIVSKKEATNVSFKVGLRFDLLGEIMVDSFWPRGIHIRPFRFHQFRRRGQRENE